MWPLKCALPNDNISAAAGLRYVGKKRGTNCYFASFACVTGFRSRNADHADQELKDLTRYRRKQDRRTRIGLLAQGGGVSRLRLIMETFCGAGKSSLYGNFGFRRDYRFEALHLGLTVRGETFFRRFVGMV